MVDPVTVITIGEKLIGISLSAYAHFKQAAADAGADTATLTALDAKYQTRIDREREIANGGQAVGEHLEG